MDSSDMILSGYIASVCLEQDNLFSYEQEITPLYHKHEQNYTKSTFAAQRPLCYRSRNVQFPSTHEVNDDATLCIYYVIFSNIKLISKPGLMNHRHDETKGT